jgi:hypothetical protein
MYNLAQERRFVYTGILQAPDPSIAKITQFVSAFDEWAADQARSSFDKAHRQSTGDRT